MRLDPIAVRIDDKRRIVTRAVIGTQAGLSVVAAGAETPGAADGIEPRAGANRVEPFAAGASERLESMPASVEGSDAASASVALAESEAETAAASVPGDAPEAVGTADAIAAADAADEVDAVDPVEAAVAVDAAGEVVAAEAVDAAELTDAADSPAPRRVVTSPDVSLVLRAVEPSVEGAASVTPAFAAGTAAVPAAAESDASVDLSWALRLRVSVSRGSPPRASCEPAALGALELRFPASSV